MSCPFYGCSLIGFDEGSKILAAQMGNRCALITAAHSPCWMEVAEKTAPEWEQCPRNPEYATGPPSRAKVEGLMRILKHGEYMQNLQAARKERT